RGRLTREPRSPRSRPPAGPGDQNGASRRHASGRRNELVLPRASQRETPPGGAQATRRVTVDQARVEGLRMLSSRDLGEERRRAISLPRLGQQLYQAEPAAGLRNGRCGDPLDELRCAFSMTGATVGGDGGAHVGDRRLDPERLKEG